MSNYHPAAKDNLYINRGIITQLTLVIDNQLGKGIFLQLSLYIEIITGCSFMFECINK